MIIKCVAIDDEPLALKQISSYIERTPSLELVAALSSATSAYEVLDNNEVDLLFVDINMPELSGMDFAKSLKQNIGIIFTTAYSEYALDGFKVNAIDYILKPIGYDNFITAVDKAKQRLSQENKSTEELKGNNDYLFIKSEYKIIRVELKNITYIEGMREYVRIHLSNQKPVITLLSFKKLMEKLPHNSFMRVHRSYIVNLKKITTIERMRIIFNEDVRIPVSEQYKEAFQKYIDENFLT
ncbi:LytR/AlgR family response regulator transcription factor [Labilibacter marinus]|uniref:LytR/AlgR family response regulator transcription factor n=1 Tax=Labilibacter marinus TaxID=1477105 RepID=UPI001E505B5C|nr:LytTR family DNA-binding domain-containing protein [Labilibacter marinus]